MTHPVRRKLREGYIRQCLDNFTNNANVIQFTSAEFTGPLHFRQFWQDTVSAWEKQHPVQKPIIALSCTKDVQDGAAVENPVSAELYRDVYRKPIVYDEVKYEGNIANRWGQLSAEELVFRFWNSTIAGTYCGHGETYKSDDQVLWWSKGGVLKGQSPARLAFLKKILDDAPAEGIEPIDKWQNPEYGGQPSEYYLAYLGKQSPTNWLFQLPKPPQGKGNPPADGMKFTAEVLDTWNMTVTPVDGVFTVKKKDNYFLADKDGRSIVLPGKPYMAIRIKRVKE